MVWDNVGHGLAMLSFWALLMLAGLLCVQLFKSFFLKERDDDDTYVIVDKTGRKITVTLKSDCSAQQRREQAEQLMKQPNLGR
jgi:hypothetical protein